MMIRAVLVMILLWFGSVGVWAQDQGQSLGELARKERERKKAQSRPNIVITNDGVQQNPGLDTPAQSKPIAQQPAMPWDLNKYPGLLPELGKFAEKLQHDIQFPPARTESHLLSLLPYSSAGYAAFSNYGDAIREALKMFREELQQSAVLRDWWQHGELAEAGPKIEHSLEKLSELHQYLGEEIVISGSLESQNPGLLIVAEIRKPGLKEFLQDTITDLAGGTKPGVRVFDLQDLASAKDTDLPPSLFVLVRPDFVAAAADVAALRRFNARLESHSGEFVSTPFGRRVAKEYEGGVTFLAAADLERILKQATPDAKQQATFQESGLADLKYFIWEHKKIAGQMVSQSELSFSAPRHGVASWLAKSGPLNSLDFVSPKAMLVGSVLLTEPSKIFESTKALLSTSNSNPFAALASFEQMMQLSLKDDLLGSLGGELTLELDSFTPTEVVWRAILKVKDASRLQQKLATLLTAMHLQTQQFDDGGIPYHTVRIPSPKAALEISYAFVDGYLIIGSSREIVAESVRLHQAGESLGKSKKLLASLPSGHSLEASALLYQDPIAMATARSRQAAPATAAFPAQFLKAATPTVVWIYGEDNAIRETSSSGAYDLGAALVVAAIAVPNLMRSRSAANEASALASLRSVNGAQMTYAMMYSKRGFAPDLATLGISPLGRGAESEGRAGLLDQSLGNASCTADAWCTKSGFRFQVTTVCKQQPCREYVVVATPVDIYTGSRSFCSTSDGVIQFKIGLPSTLPVSVADCRAWPSLK